MKAARGNGYIPIRGMPVMMMMMMMMMMSIDNCPRHRRGLDIGADIGDMKTALLSLYHTIQLV